MNPKSGLEPTNPPASAVLASGTELGPYRIESRLGAGGMGEVYRAVDTRLGRAVAVKVLPAHLSDDEEVRRRFEREARLVSSLQHPHICTLFDIGHQDGVDFLVMELLEGETLAERLAKGPLSLRQVLRHGTEIADALEAAHQKGVVHRDLKPGNVMLTAPPDAAGSSGSVRLPREREGSLVKLLDFGLAKLRPEESSRAGEVDSGSADVEELAETVTEALAATLRLDGADANDLTRRGTIVGTLPYMAPEQLQGGAIDGRTDVFAFGAVLFEMATGRRAFPQNSATSLVAAILERDPEPASELRFDLPPMLSSLCARCLAKHPADRWQSMRDVGMVLRDLSDTSQWSGVGAVPPIEATATGRGRARSSRSLAGLILGALLLGTLAFFGGRSTRPASSASDVSRPLVRFELPPVAGSLYDPVESPAILSPDGRQLAYVSRSIRGNPWNRIGLRSLDDSAAEVVLADQEAPYDLFWSNDGRSLGYYKGTGDQLFRLDVAGGPPQALAPIVDGRGATWWGDTILFTRIPTGPIYRIPADGSDREPVPVTRLEASRGDLGHVRPRFLPGGQRFVFVVQSSDPDRAGLHLASLDDPPGEVEPRRIADLGGPAEWVRWRDEDWLLFLHERHLLARKIDGETLAWIGESKVLAKDVSYVPRYQSAGFSISRTDVLAYQPAQLPSNRTIWSDRQGNQQQPVGQPGDSNLHISLDGTRLAVQRFDPAEGSSDIWLLDLVRGIEQRLTNHQSSEFGPVLSPDAQKVAFASYRSGGSGLYTVDVGTGAETVLLEGQKEWLEVVDWSPDDRWLLVEIGEAGNGDLGTFDFESRQLTRILASKFGEGSGRISADGRWMAYQSDETGRDEIYLARFPTGPSTPRYRISVDGGSAPRWRGDGSELFFIEPARMMGMVVDLELSPEADVPEAVGTPRDLFEVAGPDWIVDPKGQRFLVSTAGSEASAAPITVVLGWQAMLDGSD